jgi:tRNA threonylcarbamoyladenosine biosynthesis protein TsaB
MSDSQLIIETSGRVGQIGLVVNGVIVAERQLDEARRHARDLAAVTAAMLTQTGTHPRSVKNVVVGMGPGSFTGLRVGIMSAKAFAFATGCELTPVPTFEAIAIRMPIDSNVDVVADALKRQVYVQRFRRTMDGVVPVRELTILSVDDWLQSIPSETWITGPGVATYDLSIPASIPRAGEPDRLPTIRSLWDASRVKKAVDRATVYTLEPIYLRGSSAEEKAKTGL